jgi:hypothetical protein
MLIFLPNHFPEQSSCRAASTVKIQNRYNYLYGIDLGSASLAKLVTGLVGDCSTYSCWLLRLDGD